MLRVVSCQVTWGSIGSGNPLSPSTWIKNTKELMTDQYNWYNFNKSLTEYVTSQCLPPPPSSPYPGWSRVLPLVGGFAYLICASFIPSVGKIVILVFYRVIDKHFNSVKNRWNRSQLHRSIEILAEITTQRFIKACRKSYIIDFGRYRFQNILQGRQTRSTIFVLREEVPFW